VSTRINNRLYALMTTFSLRFNCCRPKFGSGDRGICSPWIRPWLWTKHP